ncbi:MAG: homocysteine S-methyltransferase family protein [Planctomycetes bacterium]|nr:homocysteine S-methyltransferase family protein [Planctomycetota bacterium]
MKQLLERLRAGEVLVADGAMGTMLMQSGLDVGKCPEAANLSNQQVLEDIARAYLAAGAEIIQTNTFGASPAKLALYGLAEQADEINRTAVQAVRAAVGRHTYVSGSCGPSGRILKPYGDAEPAQLYDSFHVQMEALIGAGVDLICVETMVALEEAVLAIKAAKDVSRATPVMATMTFDRTPRGFFTIMGVSIAQAAQGIEAAGADIVGSNCGNGSANMVAVAREFRAHSSQPLLIQSNAGLPETKDGQTVYRETPEFMAEKAREMVAAGVSIIGGCCGTTPEHISAIREMVDSRPAG